MMRAVGMRGPGGPSVLFVNSVARPTITRPVDILLRVHATAVNRADTMQRKGMYPAPPGCSEILGLEAAGVVEAVGEGVTKWKAGDKLMALLGGGGYAEYVTVHQDHCMPIPDGMSFADAAAIPEVYLTAFQSLFLNADTKKGDTVLMHAGASGVGTAGAMLARAVGATSITTSSEGKVAECKQFADFAVSRTKDPDTGKQFAPKVIEALGGSKVNVIVDPVFGGGYLEENAEVVAPDAQIVVLAFMGGNKLQDNDKSPFPLMFRKRTQIKFSTLRSQSDEYKAHLVSRFTNEMLPKFGGASPVLRPVVHKVLPVDEIEAAHTEVDNSQTIGKIVLTL